jgi:peptidoglycan hydrolase CwlO-like protein
MGFEKNIKTSFGFVKRDLMSVNEQINNLHDKIQHLSLNHASLLGEIKRLEADMAKLQKKPKAKKKAKKSTIKPKNAKKVVKETITYS